MSEPPLLNPSNEEEDQFLIQGEFRYAKSANLVSLIEEENLVSN